MAQGKFFRFFTSKGYSFWVVIFIVIWAAGSDMTHHKWMKDEAPNRGVIKHDVKGYYGYLPAIIIYGDAKMGFIDDPGFSNDHRFLVIKLKNGNRLIQYTSGLSILYAPFFLVAHAVAPLLGEERDGYNWVYQFFLVLSALFYVTIGLICKRKLLLRYFDDRVTALTLFILFIGTNLYYYTVYEGPMSHSYSFAFIAIFIYLVDSWYKNPTYGRSILAGLVYGMIVLIRPTNAIIVVLFFLWGITSFKALGDRFKLFLHKAPLVLLIVVFAIIPWIPQLIYWKVVTGHFIYNSYDEVGSAFYFGAPQTHKMLFSFRKGWYIYTPVMFLATIGFYFLHKHQRELFWSSSIYMAIMIYVLSSWWAWWFGGGFGSRSMVDTYAVMTLPMAALMNWIVQHRSRNLRLGAFALIIFLLYLQILQTWQYNRGSIHYVSMNKDAYWKDYFKLKGRGIWPYLSDPDHQLARKGIYYFYDWDEDYDAFRAMGDEQARDSVKKEITTHPKTMRSISRHARRNNITKEEALDQVVDRVTEEKMDRQNLK